MSVTSPRTRSHDEVAGAVTDALRAFVHLQARPSRVAVALEGDGRPCAPVPQLPDDRCVPLPAGWATRQQHLTHPPRHRPGPPRATVTPDHVLDLVAAAAVQRLEPRSAVNPHRAYPAAHCFFAATVFVVADGCAWAFDPVRYCLVPVRGGATGVPGSERPGSPAERFRAAVETAQGALLVVLAQLEGMPERYHELRWSLVLSESGHVSELLVHGARAAGLTVRTQDHFVDAELLAALGARSPGLVPTTVLELGDVHTGEAVARVLGGTTPIGDPPRPVGLPADLAQVDRQGWYAQDPARPAVDRTHRGSSPLLGSAGWTEVLFHRSAGRVNKGLTARPVPLSAQAAHDAVHAVAEVLVHEPPAHLGGVTAYLVADRVTGHEQGMHVITPRGQTELVGTVDGISALQAVFSYPRAQMAVDSCPAGLVLAVDYDRLLQHRGPRQLRISQLDIGRAFQAAGLALTLHDAFLRPARSYDTDRLAALLALPSGTLPIYVGLIGQSRFVDLLMDVRP